MEKHNSPSVIKVVLADDHEIFRDGFRVMLKKHPTIQLVGEAGDGRELVAKVKALEPDVVVTDIKMPILDGIGATRELIALRPSLGIVALSMFDEENLIMDMLDAGAKGYLLKNAHKKEIFAAIESIYRGDIYYCDHTSSRLINMLAKSSALHPSKKEVKAEFTSKELEIIQLICKEGSNKEIAEEVNLTVRTIEKYRERIHEKIGARNVAGVVVYAIRHGIYKL